MQNQTQFVDLLAAVRLAERSITLLADDLDGIREDQSRDQLALVRAEEQLRQVRESLSSLERVIRGDGAAEGLAQQVLDLRRAEASLRESVASLSDAGDARATAEIQVRGQHTQALATIVAALLGAVSGIISLLITTMRH